MPTFVIGHLECSGGRRKHHSLVTRSYLLCCPDGANGIQPPPPRCLPRPDYPFATSAPSKQKREKKSPEVDTSSPGPQATMVGRLRRLRPSVTETRTLTAVVGIRSDARCDVDTAHATSSRIPLTYSLNSVSSKYHRRTAPARSNQGRLWWTILTALFISAIVSKVPSRSCLQDTAILRKHRRHSSGEILCATLRRSWLQEHSTSGLSQVIQYTRSFFTPPQYLYSAAKVTMSHMRTRSMLEKEETKKIEHSNELQKVLILVGISTVAKYVTP